MGAEDPFDSAAPTILGLSLLLNLGVTVSCLLGAIQTVVVCLLLLAILG